VLRSISKHGSMGLQGSYRIASGPRRDILRRTGEGAGSGSRQASVQLAELTVGDHELAPC
jgi:hypothetical protein